VTELSGGKRTKKKAMRKDGRKDGIERKCHCQFVPVSGNDHLSRTEFESKRAQREKTQGKIAKEEKKL